MSVPSPSTMAAFATTLIVFGIVGWSTGWLVASGEQTNLGQGSSPGPVVTQETPKKISSPTPSPTPAPSHTRETPHPCSTAPNAFPMPDLVKQNYMDARRKGHGLGLTVNVRFDQEGNRPAGTVVGTNPDKDVCIIKGWSITLLVTGPAPRPKVPEVLGLPCQPDAVDRVVDAGLTIGAYPSGPKGKVQRTDPPIGSELPWNAKVQLYCSESAS